MDDLHGLNGDSVHIPGDSTVPYTIEMAIADATDWLTGDPLPNSTLPDSTSDVQHWLWTGHRLVRTSPEAAERLRQQEVWEQAELQHGLEIHRAYRQRRRESYRRCAKRIVTLLHYLVRRCGSGIHAPATHQ
jgi:hypothetical protein